MLAMHLERDGDGLPAGARVPARLKERLGLRGIALLPGGEEAVIEPWPAGLAEGATIRVEVRRAAWREPGRVRIAKVRATDLPEQPPLPLAARLAALGHRPVAGWPADVAAAWDEGWEAAELGRMAFPGGSLSLTPTPAMVAVDVDGAGSDLAGPALVMLARLIRLWGLGGSVVIDLPALSGKAARTAAADAFDRAMGWAAPGSWERTAINGFGLMQIVLQRPGPSILERARLETVETAAIGLLESAAREPRPGSLRILAAPAIAGWLEARPHLLARLARQAGRRVDVRADFMAGKGHVEPAD